MVRQAGRGMVCELPFDRQTWERVSHELQLPPQLHRVAEQVLLGRRDKQIAQHLGIAEPTVRTYMARLFRLLGASDRMEVALRVFAVAWKLRPPLHVIAFDDTKTTPRV